MGNIREVFESEEPFIKAIVIKDNYLENLRLMKSVLKTQTAVADKLGVPPASVSCWLKGKYKPSAEPLIAIWEIAQNLKQYQSQS